MERDENYLLAAARYLEGNPVWAGVVEKPWEYPWSNASAHLAGRDDLLVKVSPLLQVVGEWKEFLLDGEKEIKEIRRHKGTGRPLGRDSYVIGLEKALGRTLRYQKSGPKGKKKQYFSMVSPESMKRFGDAVQRLASKDLLSLGTKIKRAQPPGNRCFSITNRLFLSPRNQRNQEYL